MVMLNVVVLNVVMLSVVLLNVVAPIMSAGITYWLMLKKSLMTWATGKAGRGLDLGSDLSMHHWRHICQVRVSPSCFVHFSIREY
jgi:hypothetical protein